MTEKPEYESRAHVEIKWAGEGKYSIASYIDGAFWKRVFVAKRHIEAARRRWKGFWKTQVDHVTADEIPKPFEIDRKEKVVVVEEPETKELVPVETAQTALVVTEEAIKILARDILAGASNGLLEPRLRQLTSAQRAAIAAEMLPVLIEQRRHGPKSKNGSPRMIGDSVAYAGAAVGVGKTNVATVARLKEREPSLYAQIVSGEITVAKANDLYRDAHPKMVVTRNRLTVKKAGPPKHYSQKYIDRHGPIAMQRMIDGLSHVKGVCQGLPELDLGLIAAAVSEEDRKMWAEIAREAASVLREFALNLRETEP
jgi:hypothetical protein